MVVLVATAAETLVGRPAPGCKAVEVAEVAVVAEGAAGGPTDPLFNVFFFSTA
jgi:hypothetical protein